MLMQQGYVMSLKKLKIAENEVGPQDLSNLFIMCDTILPMIKCGSV